VVVETLKAVGGEATAFFYDLDHRITLTAVNYELFAHWKTWRPEITISPW